MEVVNRFDVFLIDMDEPPLGDAKNTRPAVVISPDELNNNLQTVVVAPIATTRATYPTRVSFEFLGNERHVVLDQLRTVDKVRLTKKIGSIDGGTQKKIVDRLLELFSE